MSRRLIYDEVFVVFVVLYDTYMHPPTHTYAHKGTLVTYIHVTYIRYKRLQHEGEGKKLNKK